MDRSNCQQYKEAFAVEVVATDFVDSDSRGVWMLGPVLVTVTVTMTVIRVVGVYNVCLFCS